MSAEENKNCVRRHFETLWNQGQLATIDDFFSPNFTNFGLRYSEVRGMIQHIVGVWRKAFPDLHFTVDSLIAEGDSVIAEVTVTGTHLGEFQLVPPLQGPNLAPTGRTFHVKHIHRFRLEEAKIVEHFAVRDDLGMFQQLGNLSALGA